MAAGDDGRGGAGTVVSLAIWGSIGPNFYGRGMQAVSLFSGAGGLDLGCECAGFRTVAAVENDPRARETMLANRKRFFPHLREDALLKDITEVEAGDLLDRAGVEAGELALLHGGPPCTPFSKSGYWLEYKRAGKDPRASLLDEYVRILRGASPQAFLMENVYGLAYRNQNREVLQRFIAGCREAGYLVDHQVLLAADFAVPQLRQRLFCVGVRRDLVADGAANWGFAWPTPTHAGPHETRKNWDDDLPPHITAGEAFDGLSSDANPAEPEEEVEGTHADSLRGIPPGQNYLFWTEQRGNPSPRFKWRSRYWSFLLKLSPGRPSPTIQGQPGPWVGPFHWDNRRLRVAEVKRLMTFPDEFVVGGTRRDVQLQLGNAVPPVLGEAVARALAVQIRDISDAAEPLVTLAA